MFDDFTTTLLGWFGHNARPLPWRQTRDAYAIWLSEVILQQTRVEQGTDYWFRFLRRFPTVEALAAASEDEVLRLWQGLGYYSRARNLHAAAQQVVAQGAFPGTLEGLRALKGVGDYTAAAVASFAFGVRAAAVDVNVYRVLARHYGIDTPVNTTEGKHLFAALADELLPTRQAGTFNQALMDFGATLCTPRSPRCAECPVAATCIALREGRVEALPVKLAKTKVTERRLAYIYIRCKGFTAIHRRGPGDIWQGLWEPVIGEWGMDNGNWEMDNGQWTMENGEGTMDNGQWTMENGEWKMDNGQWTMKNGEGKMDKVILLAKDVKHVLTHRILLADFYYVETSVRPSLPPDYRWIPESALYDYGKPRLVERLLEMLPSRQ